ncbi:MAG: hypothetical protein KDA32_01590 [Phycisphaerales bacterium]|nr:hypothetical protein [Phycisphaerales bacterium]
MPLVAGIDEAGYGPTLGPLVVGASVWRVPDADVNIWRALRACVCKADASSSWKLAVDDSKKVYGASRKLESLERPVLAFASAAGVRVGCLSQLLADLGSARLSEPHTPWYDALETELPVEREKSAFESVAARLSREMDKSGVSLRGMMARVVGEARFNDRVRQTRNKGAVLIEQVLDLITRIVRRAGSEPVSIHVDRLGGRANYREMLAQALPAFELAELEISDGVSAYQLTNGDQKCRVDFATESEQRHLPVALASMVAKYLREVLMRHFNAWWRGHLPDARPTAGYYNDAQRFLADIAPVITKAGVDPAHFVRER